jgi:thiol peroxidase
MANITLDGHPAETSGTLPSVGEKLKKSTLVKSDLSRTTLDDFKGTKLVLNIFPSLRTGVCAASIRRFNEEAASLHRTKVLCISRDLPFAQQQFCGAEGLENVITLSDFESGEFGKDNGLEIISGAFKGLHSRVVMVLDEEGTILYTQQVPEIGNEPDYEAALEFVKQN